MNSILSNLLRQKGLTEEKHKFDGRTERFFFGIALRQYDEVAEGGTFVS